MALIEKEQHDAIERIAKYLEEIKGCKLENALSIIKKTPSNRSKYFDGLIFDASEVIDEESLGRMKRDKLLYELAFGQYVITLKFLIVREFDHENLGIWGFIDQLNEKYFESLYYKKTQPLAGDEKAIILALIGLMSFNEDSAFKADSDYKSSTFKKCVERIVEFLKDCSYNDSSLNNVWSIKARGEEEVQAKLARLKDVGTKTSNIYQKDRKGGHFIDILDGENINKSKFNELMKKIFDKGPLSLEMKDKLIEILKQINGERNDALSNPIPVNPNVRAELYANIREWVFENE